MACCSWLAVAGTDRVHRQRLAAALGGAPVCEWCAECNPGLAFKVARCTVERADGACIIHERHSTWTHYSPRKLAPLPRPWAPAKLTPSERHAPVPATSHALVPSLIIYCLLWAFALLQRRSSKFMIATTRYRTPRSEQEILSFTTLAATRERLATRSRDLIYSLTAGGGAAAAPPTDCSTPSL